MSIKVDLTLRLVSWFITLQKFSGCCSVATGVSGMSDMFVCLFPFLFWYILSPVSKV